MPVLFKDAAFWNVVAVLLALVACVYGLYSKELNLAQSIAFFTGAVAALRVAVAIESHADSTVTAAKIRAGADKNGGAP